MKVKIDKDVPVIQPRQTSSLYPWATMGVGDSFFVATSETESSAKFQSRISAAACSYQRNHGQKFTTRCITESGVAGVRVWRVE
jgi:hypothetical protein